MKKWWNKINGVEYSLLMTFILIILSFITYIILVATNAPNISYLILTCVVIILKDINYTKTCVIFYRTLISHTNVLKNIIHYSMHEENDSKEMIIYKDELANIIEDGIKKTINVYDGND